MVLENSLSPSFRVARKRKKKAARAKIRAEIKAGSSALQLLVLTQFFPPDFAATGQLIEELAGQLGKQNVDVSVFTGQPGYAFAEGEAPAVEQKGNVFVKRSRVSQLFANRIRGKALGGLMYTLRAIAHLTRNASRYQVLLVTTAPPFLSVIAYFANIFFKLPYVCLLYDLYPDIAIELGIVKTNHPIAKLWRSLNGKIWQRSAGIIVLSDSMQQRIVSHCPQVADKISVIHSWSNDRQIVPIAKKDNWFAQKHGLVEPFVVLYSGNMGRCHDIDTIFNAAQLLKEEPILFLCIGGGAKRTLLKEKVSQSSLNNFRFLPYQKKAILPYSLTACDISLVSVAEGMESLVAPSKIYSAMAAGRPIAAICPQQSYLHSLLASAQGGITFKNGASAALADYIRQMSQNTAALERVGTKNRRYMQNNFTLDKVSRQYLGVLKQASAGKSR